MKRKIVISSILTFSFLVVPAFPQILGQGSQQSQGRMISANISFIGGAATAVQVTIESANRSINRTLFSDTSGGFSASGLPPGEYYITLEAPGFATNRTRIEVTPGNGVLVFQFMMRAQPLEVAGPGNPISVASLKVPAPAQQEFEKGLAEWKKNRAKEARQRFESALQKHERFPEALWALAQLDIAENQPSIATDRLRKAVEFDPAFYHGHLSLSRLLNQSGESAQSLEEADKAIAARPELWEGHYERGIAALSLNRLQLAEESLSRVAELGKGKVPEARLLRSGLLLKANNLVGARTELEAFLKEAPRHASASLARSILDRIASTGQPN
jgi:tetratricopeptide (TPR) repeat protein